MPKRYGQRTIEIDASDRFDRAMVITQNRPELATRIARTWLIDVEIEGKDLVMAAPLVKRTTPHRTVKQIEHTARATDRAAAKAAERREFAEEA